MVAVIGSIVLLFNLALAYPLLDLVGRNAEFFVAHDASRLTVVLLALLLTLVVPALIALLVVLVERLNLLAGRVIHLVVLGLMVAALALQTLKNVGVESSVPGALVVVAAVSLGALGAVGYHFLSPVRVASRFGLLLPPLVIVLFASTDAGSLIFPSDGGSTAVTIDRDPVPIVMVVFDEFPVASLVTGSLGIDEQLFPSFARLAREGTWYRNATTVDTHTRWAVPAMVDGRFPDRQLLPTAGDHPENLFRLLSPVYDVHAHETMTALCPDEVCTDQPSTSTTTAMKAIFSDLGVVSAHLLYPTQWSASLPPLDEGWAHFGERQEDGDEEDGAFTWDKDARLGDLPGQFRGWVRGLPSTAQDNVLAFHHSLLVHKPWRYLPSGQEYPNVMFTAIQKGVWTNDRWLSAQGHQRHLLQVQAADTLVGELLQKLETSGMYDEALVIVTADHGISLQSGASPRKLTSETLLDIAAVPLFIKYPGQVDGGVESAPVQTVDVFPTILDVLGSDSDPGAGGRSLLRDLDDGRERTIRSGGADGTVELPVSIDDYLRDRAAVREGLLDLPATDRDQLYELVPSGLGELLGTPVEELVEGPRAPFSAVLRVASSYEDVDPTGATMPALIGGELDTRLPNGERITMAVAVNGRIAGVTRSLNRGSAQRPTEFSAMIDPATLTRGANDVQFYLVEPHPEGQVTLRHVPRQEQAEQ